MGKKNRSEKKTQQANEQERSNELFASINEQIQKDSANDAVEETAAKAEVTDLPTDEGEQAVSSFLSMKQLTPENQAKLDRYEDMKVEIEALNVKVGELTDKASEYLQEIEELKAQLNKKDSGSEASSVVDEAKDQEIENLKLQLSDLQNQADQWMKRVGELTFENAKLRAESGIKKQISNPQVPVCTDSCGQQPPRHSSPNVRYIQHRMNNGYSDWN